MSRKWSPTAAVFIPMRLRGPAGEGAALALLSCGWFGPPLENRFKQDTLAFGGGLRLDGTDDAAPIVQVRRPQMYAQPHRDVSIRRNQTAFRPQSQPLVLHTAVGVPQVQVITAVGPLRIPHDLPAVVDSGRRRYQTAEPGQNRHPVQGVRPRSEPPAVNQQNGRAATKMASPIRVFALIPDLLRFRRSRPGQYIGWSPEYDERISNAWVHRVHGFTSTITRWYRASRGVPASVTSQITWMVLPSPASPGTVNKASCFPASWISMVPS
jgi:hypothetical protein